MGVSAAVAGVGLVQGYMSSQAASDAADTQAQAAAQNIALQKEISDKQMAFQRQQYEDAIKRNQPYLEAGKSALAQLSAGLGEGGKFTKDFQFNPEQDPSYQWRFLQGQRALDAAASARGNMFTPAQQLALQNYGQNAASQEYQNAFNRYQTEVGNQYNRLSGLAGTGQSVASGTNQLGANTAAQMGSSLGTMGTNVANINAANAASQGAADIAKSNAWSGALSNLAGAGINAYMNQTPSAASLPTVALNTGSPAVYGPQFGSGGLW